MEFAVGGLVGFLDTLDGFDDIESFDEPRIDVGDITYAPYDRLEMTGRYMRLDIVGLEDFFQRFKLRSAGVVFQFDYT